MSGEESVFVLLHLIAIEGVFTGACLMLAAQEPGVVTLASAAICIAVNMGLCRARGPKG